jgi:hypothetical protein
MVRPIGRRMILSSLLMIGLAGMLTPPSSWDTDVAGNGTNTTLALSQDATPLSCGVHTILLDVHQMTPIGRRGEPTRLRVFHDHHQVWSLNEIAIMDVECRSLTGDGVPGLIITTYSFGAHCCTTIYVLSLRSEPKLLMRFFEGNGGGYEVRDLKGDGHLQLILNDDSFAYFGGLSYAGSPARLPLVACYGHGSFIDCTRQFPDVVRDSSELYRGEFMETQLRIKSGEIETSPGWPADFSIAGPVLGIYANSALLGQESEGWAVVRSSIRSERVLGWFECHRSTVLRWARHREEILLNSDPPSHPIWNTRGCEKWEPGRTS